MNLVVETECNSSAVAILSQLPEAVPMLALGQTVFWDEPMKASLLPLLQACQPSRPFLFGVHDTDYFGRAHTRAIPTEAAIAEGFAMLPHNDGTTRALWASAGEISALFGCEIFPTREQFRRAGISLERLGRSFPQGYQAFVDQLTEAWGWRGLVTTDPHPLPVAEVPVARVVPALEVLIRWGLEQTLERLADPDQHRSAQARAVQLLEALHQRACAMPNGNLADLYRYLYPDFLRALIGDIPETVGFTRTSELLRFNTQTAPQRRFRLVSLFLNPETRSLCEAAYNASVAGSETYTLPHFGEGALPFDLLIPQRGRGTLLITERYLTILTPEPIVLRLAEPIHSAESLAQVVEHHFGTQCVLVGKAITLVSMLAHEFVFVFNTRGSPYLKRTIAMNRHLAQAGIALPLHPLIRVQYPTWDSLRSVKCIPLRLPNHLADAFGQQEICSHEFARCWRQVVQEQQALLNTLASLKRPRDLMRFLADHEGAHWASILQEYEAVQAQLKAIGAQAEQLRQQAHQLHNKRRQLKQECSKNPALARKLYDIKMQLRALNRQRLAIGRTAEAQRLRRHAHSIEDKAEMTRAHLVRRAILTAEGLPYTNARPAGWWFRVVAPEWFRACAQHVQITTEPLI